MTVGFNGGTPAQDHGLQWAQCRQAALGHQWKHDNKPIDPDLNKHGYRAPLTMTNAVIGWRSHCTYCNTDKVKWIDRSDHTIVTRYYHPDGYSRTGEEALDATEWREVWLVHAIADMEREQQKQAAKRQAS